MEKIMWMVIFAIVILQIGRVIFLFGHYLKVRDGIFAGICGFILVLLGYAWRSIVF